MGQRKNGETVGESGTPVCDQDIHQFGIILYMTVMTPTPGPEAKDARLGRADLLKCLAEPPGRQTGGRRAEGVQLRYIMV